MNEWLPYLIAALGPLGVLWVANAQRRKLASETRKTDADVANEAAEINLKREEFWQRKLDDAVRPLQREIASLRTYINQVVPWTWGAARTMKLQGIEYQDPPSLLPVTETE